MTANVAASEHGTLRKDQRLLVGSLLCGIVFDFLFYDKPAGVSHPLFLAALYVYFNAMLKEKAKLRYDGGTLLLLTIALLSLTYVVFSNELFRLLNTLAVPALIAMHTTWAYGGQKGGWHEPGFLSRAFGQAVVGSLRQLPEPLKVLLATLRKQVRASRYTAALKISIGLLIAAPLLFIVIVLLASADKMFDHVVSGLPRMLERIDFGSAVSHAVVIGFLMLVLFCFTRGLLYSAEPKSNKEEPWAELTAAGPIRFDPLVTATVLVCVNLVYVIFVVVQFSYLFGGGEGTLPDGVTYAEYARRGFMELVAVTSMNFAMLLAVLYRVRKEGMNLHRVNRGLLGLMTGCTAVMLFSAYYRLSLYEQAYGYTYTRLLVHAFMIFLLVLFLIALYKIVRETAALARPFLIASLVAYMTVNYMNIDAIIARNNIARFEASGNVDEAYLAGLSPDAAPQLAKLYEAHPELAVLGDGLRRMRDNLSAPAPWMSYNVSKQQARKALEGLRLP
ncbi:DUF4153 domain-containing protein [Paenibacillus hamazuiensis]|uniref:DUF4153 domain-containing protein n=1 Tax=Paenibacillus hamazuiensis TaxID=2936508 RepID=UPI00200CDDD8|nr:DUF4173 domain-containing protein [Paenibacillus hamazuiensis]